VYGSASAAVTPDRRRPRLHRSAPSSVDVLESIKAAKSRNLMQVCLRAPPVRR